MCIAGCFGSFISAFLLQLTASRHHLRPPPVSINSITGTTTYSSSNSISLPRAQTPPNTRRQPPMAPWAIPFACTNSIRLTPTRHRLRHHHHLTHRRQTPLLPAHRRHRHHSLRPRGSTGTSSHSSVFNSNHPRILALHGVLLGLKCHSRTSTPPSHPAHPMVPTRRDRRLADF